MNKTVTHHHHYKTNKMGRIELVIGPMYAGKSTELVRIYNKFKLKYNIIIINHAKDTRYGMNIISTHNKNMESAIALDNLLKLQSDPNFREMYQLTEVIMIDEAQFFSDLYEFATKAADEHNKIVIVFGLNGDYKRNKFGQVLNLIPHADQITHMKAFCHYCHDPVDAPFTKRIADGDEQTLVGSNESYVAVCRKHYLTN